MIVATHTPIGVITTEITVTDSQILIVTTEGVSTASMPAFKVETREAALRGPRGPSAVEAQISADPDNRLKPGSDGGLYVADNLDPNPLDHYLLERGII